MKPSYIGGEKMLTVDEVKLYLRVDFADDDNLINLLISNAETYLRDSIEDYDRKVANDSFKNKAKLAMLVLIADWYDNRNFTTSKVEERTKYTIQSLIQQMKYGYGDGNEIQKQT